MARFALFWEQIAGYPVFLFLQEAIAVRSFRSKSRFCAILSLWKDKMRTKTGRHFCLTNFVSQNSRLNSIHLYLVEFPQAYAHDLCIFPLQLYGHISFYIKYLVYLLYPVLIVHILFFS